DDTHVFVAEPGGEARGEKAGEEYVGNEEPFWFVGIPPDDEGEKENVTREEDEGLPVGAQRGQGEQGDECDESDVDGDSAELDVLIQFAGACSEKDRNDAS